jgi:hypothetical protein
MVIFILNFAGEFIAVQQSNDCSLRWQRAEQHKKKNLGKYFQSAHDHSVK